MRRLMLVAIGVIPLILGYFINYIIVDLDMYGSIITVISFLFLILWFLLGTAVARMKIKLSNLNAYCLLICMINLILTVYQFVVPERWLQGYPGLVSQFYVLPVIRVISIMDLFNVMSHVYVISIFGNCLIIGVFFLGTYISRKQQLEYDLYMRG